jgi:hypothetical protein
LLCIQAADFVEVAGGNVCREIGATVLIDDNPRYATECAAAGIDVLLYDWNLGYPWSKTPDGCAQRASGSPAGSSAHALPCCCTCT